MESPPLRPTQFIVAQGYGGHRLMYVRLLAEAALARGRSPHVLTSRGALDSAEYSMHLAPLGRELRVTELKRVTIEEIRRVVEGDSRLRTVFTEGDAWLGQLATAPRLWPGGARILVMRAAGQSSTGAVRRVQSAVKAAIRAVGRARPDLQVLTLSSFSTEDGHRFAVPDPVTLGGSDELAALIRDNWKVAARGTDAFWFGIVGAINARKNVDLVARSMSRLRELSVGVAVAGKCAEGEHRLDDWLEPLRRAEIPVIRITGVMPDDELDSILRALDCVVLAHSNEGPSGVFGKAAAAGTRIVAAGATSLRKDVASLGQGATWVPLEEDQLTRALRDAIDSAAPRPRSTGSDNFVSRLLD